MGGEADGNRESLEEKTTRTTGRKRLILMKLMLLMRKKSGIVIAMDARLVIFQEEEEEEKRPLDRESFSNFLMGVPCYQVVFSTSLLMQHNLSDASYQGN